MAPLYIILAILALLSAAIPVGAVLGCALTRHR
jgi:hypothetical protein